MTDLEALKARLREMTPQSPFAPTENWPPHKAADAIERLEAENAKLREALKSKPWPPTDAELREMLALIVGAWWSESSANRIRTARNLNIEDIKGMYAVRDALAPYTARAALEEATHDRP